MAPRHPACHICIESRAHHLVCACGFVTCRGCARRCVEERDDGNACQQCARPWSSSERHVLLGKTFTQDRYRKRRQQVLLLREQPRFARAAPLVTRTRAQRELAAEIRMARAELRNGRGSRIFLQQLYHMASLQRRGGVSAVHAIRCAAAGCTGIVLDGSGACSACSAKTCSDCGMLLPHARCDTAALESLRHIRMECRPCPSCGAPSSRTEGCPVMWCARCHAFWNWDTGMELAVRNRARAPHNPDHRAWLARGDATASHRELDDLPCGGIPPDADMYGLFRASAAATASGAVTIGAAVDAIRRAQRMRHAFPLRWSEEILFRSLRVRHLLGELDENAFSARLYRAERRAEFRRDVGYVLESFVLAGIDTLQCMCYPHLAPPLASRTTAQLVQLRDIAARELEAIACIYARRTPTLDGWVWTWLTAEP